MGLGRVARMWVALAAASAAAGASAQVLPRAVALYPLAKGEGAGADVQSLLDVALRRAAQRNDDIAVTEPIVLRAACGAAPSAALSCLAKLAGPGLVLRARVQRAGEMLVVAIDAIDAAARSFGPVSASVDDYIQNAEPLAQAILLLVRQALAAGPPPPGPKAAPVADATAVPVPPPPGPKAAPVADATAAPVPPPTAQKAEPVADAATAVAPPPVQKAEPPPAEPPRPDASKADLKVVTPPPLAAAVAAVSRPSAPPRAWMRKAGPWMTAAGGALLAGGVAVSLLNRSLSSDLEAKHGAGTLTPADLSSYDRVEQYNQLATILYASGGALTLSGIAVWTAAPAAGRAVAVAGVSGRF